MATRRERQFDLACAGALALVSGIVYALTISVGAYPGFFAPIITQHVGLYPRLTPDHPLWSLIACGVAKLGPTRDVAAPLNMLSVIFGGLGVGAAYLGVQRLLSFVVEPDGRERRVSVATRLGGGCAAMAMAFSVPYWIVSNRAHWTSFHVLLLFVALLLFLRWVDKPSTLRSVLFWFVYGLGIVESAVFIPFLPIFAFAMLSVLWQNEQLGIKPIIIATGALVTGLCLYLIAAFMFYGSEGYELREYKSFFDVLWYMWRDQWYQISRGIPRRGWLIIMLLSVVPWVTSLLVARRALNDERDWTYAVLHVVMTGVTVCMLVGLKIAPWPMLGLGRLLVMPYVLAASLFGYLVAYWWLLSARWWGQDSSPFLKAVKVSLGPVVVIPGLVFLCWLPFKNLADANARSSRMVARYAQAVVASLNGRSILITDGLLDSHLRIAAREAGVSVRFISLRADSNSMERNYLAKHFSSPELRSRLRIGIMPFLGELHEQMRDFSGTVALLVNPDLWLGFGNTPIPNQVVFLGGEAGSDVDCASTYAQHEAFWSTVGQALYDDTREPGLLKAYADYIRRRLSLPANNLGVLLEDLNCKDPALAAYAWSRRLDEGNISALLNLETARRDGLLDAEQAADIERAFNVFAEDADKRAQIASLAVMWGYVRVPEAFVDAGRSWALSGMPGLAIPMLKKAMNMVPPEQQQRVKSMLAGLYFSQADDVEGEALYYELLVENPKNQHALLGMAHIATRKAEYGEAEKYLRAAEEVGVPEVFMELEWAQLDAIRGRLGAARTRLEALVKERPDLRRGWHMLTGIMISQGDPEGLEWVVMQLRNREKRTIELAVAEGYLAMMRKETALAARFFEEAIVFNPRDTRVLEILIQLDVTLNRLSDSRRHVRQLLRLDPANALGNRMMGVFYAAEEDYGLAEDALRRSLAKHEDPGTMNDLAWILKLRGAFDEAETYVRRALARQQEFSPAWDTLGAILLKKNQMSEAETAFRKAILFANENMAAKLHLASMLLDKGDMVEAEQLLADVASVRDRLPETQRHELQALLDRL